MSSSWSADTRFKRTEIIKFPQVKSRQKTSDWEYWRHLQSPVTIREHGPVQKVDVCRVSPFFVAVTGSSRVQIFHPETNDVHKTLSKFRETAYGGKFRNDGQLLCVGGDDGAVKIFDVSTKSQLRSLRGHANATHVAHFVDNKNLTSFSDDKTVRVWDISTEDELAKFDEHTDYVRAGCVSPASSNVIVSGSYDHSAHVWDIRQPDSPIRSFVHGSPVEDVLVLPNGTLLLTAGGNEVKVWDLMGGGNRLLASISVHNKTVTSLGMATGNTRIVTASLDRHVKFHDVSTFQTVHSVAFPSPILSAVVAPDDSFVGAGMSDGLVQFLHRRVPPSLEERQAERMRSRPSHKYLRYTQFEASPDDVVVKEEKHDKESRHDHFLRKFEYSKALDQVLKPYVMRKHPDYTFSVLRELYRRNGLKTAIGGRTEKGLAPLLQFLLKNITDARFSSFLVQVVDMTLNLYASTLGSCPTTDRLFINIRKRVDMETRSMRHLMMLQGAIDLVLTASNSSEKPRLRAEEIALRERLKADKNKLAENQNTCFYKAILQ